MSRVPTTLVSLLKVHLAASISMIRTPKMEIGQTTRGIQGRMRSSDVSAGPGERGERQTSKRDIRVLGVGGDGPLSFSRPRCGSKQAGWSAVVLLMSATKRHSHLILHVLVCTRS
ncbi:uncharacterized protein B0T15DRAFT_540531 [Chaetomium strumarium]|uniref:Secreted protein n=1 Tax=Chaetomium strumarium TaxID=1170767 RepID=A0AAJ0GP58_9PEZI|nr:hypothetical protein B0T15DRAFT_540531 [Chaetomium strumarium]